MCRRNAIRAWKDPEYRASLSAEELAELPNNPAGAIELPDTELDQVSGGAIIVRKPRTALCPTVPDSSIERGNCPTFLCSGYFCSAF